MVRTRALHHPSTGKLWATRTEGTQVTITSGAKGKLKEAQKPQKDELATQRFLQKEEGAQFRKGFVLVKPEAEPGEPIMLRHLARGYTGALAIVEHEGTLLVNQFNDAQKGDELWQITRDGGGGPIVEIGADRLLGKIVAAGDRFLLRVDSQIQRWDPLTRAIEALSPRSKELCPFLDSAQGMATWYEAPEIVVRDLRAGTDRLRLPVTAHRMEGGALQCVAALSADGATLAVCVEPNQITLHDVKSGAKTATIAGAFAGVQQLVFAADARTLLVKEFFGQWKMLAFDLERKSWSAIGEDLGPNSNEFAVDTARGRLAIFSYGTVYVYDLPTKAKLREFALDQTVKSANFAWTHDGLLAMHSDLGYVGLYRV